MSGDHDDGAPVDSGEATPLSSREWLGRVRQIDPADWAPPRVQLPSRRFTWWMRSGIVLAALFYGALVVWTGLDVGLDLTGPRGVLFGLAVLVAAVALVEAWRWAVRPRLDASQSEAITAGLLPETTKAVRRMAAGRGPDRPELRSRAGAYAWARQQSGLPGALVALGNLANLALSSGSTVGIVLSAVVLLLTAPGVGHTLWMGHRARSLGFPTPSASSTVSS